VNRWDFIEATRARGGRAGVRVSRAKILTVRSNPQFSLDDAGTIKRLIRENPWATLVSMTSAGLVASHYPVVLEEQREDISVVGHVGRPDEELHELGEHELILIVQGPHGYISSSWYGAAPAVPTWNFIVVHLHGVPEILSAEDNLEVLGQLVDHFERRVAEPRPLHRSEGDSTFERALSRGTVGFRLTPSRITAKQKMSQNKSREVFTTVLAQLEGDGPYGDSLLAREMRLARTGL
jgi:transcriptional regulator